MHVCHFNRISKRNWLLFGNFQEKSSTVQSIELDEHAWQRNMGCMTVFRLGKSIKVNGKISECYNLIKSPVHPVLKISQRALKKIF